VAIVTVSITLIGQERNKDIYIDLIKWLYGFKTPWNGLQQHDYRGVTET